MKWFNRKTKFQEEIHFPNIQPLPHQLEAINQTLITFKGYTENWGRQSGKTATKIYIASALLEGTDYYIVRDVK